MSNSSKLFRPEKLLGKVPTKSLSLASNTVRFPSNPISGGKQPLSSLLRKMISFKFGMLPMVRGTQPLNLLLANVTTVAVEFPNESGILSLNLLLFKKIASSSLTKSSGGISPSKSLYLRSRYLTTGQFRTTLGNGPTKRLLLTSNSCISTSLLKLSGMIPQNRLELMWKRAMSVKRPNSAGR